MILSKFMSWPHLSALISAATEMPVVRIKTTVALITFIGLVPISSFGLVAHQPKLTDLFGIEFIEINAVLGPNSPGISSPENSRA